MKGNHDEAIEVPQSGMQREAVFFFAAEANRDTKIT
jgi:hypothetical protein